MTRPPHGRKSQVPVLSIIGTFVRYFHLKWTNNRPKFLESFSTR
jgi:hypothetical protein